MGRANKRLDVLIEKLGLTEYYYSEDVSFYENLGNRNGEKGILHDLQKEYKFRTEYLTKLIHALMTYLDVDLVEENSPTFKMVKNKKTTAKKTTSRRKIR